MEADPNRIDQKEKEGSVNSVTELLFNGKSGFGYGDGLISRAKQLLSGELHKHYEEIAERFIKHDIRAFVHIDKLDDGCSDGRVAEYAEQMQNDGTIEHSESLLHRAKVFGGGLMMTVSGKIGTGVIAPTVMAQFENGLNFLNAKEKKFGAHDDDHATGENCGCGAIDKYPDNLKNTQVFKTEIKDSFVTLFGDAFNEETFEDVSENYRKAYAVVAGEPSYSGKKIRDAIAKTGAVIKRLKGKHQEDFVVINFVPNTTLDQAELMKITDDNVQAFCIDAWRLVEYAESIADGDADAQQQALYGMLMYTLATSATLTDGSQRVFIRK